VVRAVELIAVVLSGTNFFFFFVNGCFGISKEEGCNVCKVVWAVMLNSRRYGLDGIEGRVLCSRCTGMAVISC